VNDFLRSYQIENVELWKGWKQRIAAAGYSIWQTAYGWDLPEGYTAGFINVDTDERFEIVTHSKEIAEAIIHSGL